MYRVVQATSSPFVSVIHVCTECELMREDVKMK